MILQKGGITYTNESKFCKADGAVLAQEYCYMVSVLNTFSFETH